MLKLRRFLKPVWRDILFAIIFIAGQVILQLQLPKTVADVGKYIEAMSINPSGSAEYNQALTEIWVMGGWMILFSVGVTICAILAGYFSARIGTIFGRVLRNAVFDKVTNMSLADYDSFGTSSLITRTTNDVQQLQMVLIMGLRIIVAAPLTVVFSLIYASAINMRLMIVLLVSIPVVLIVTAVIGKLLMPFMKIMQSRIDRVTLVLRENLTGIRVIRAFNREKEESVKFDKANKELTGTTIKVNKIFAAMMPSITVVMNLTYLSILVVGFYGFINISASELSTQMSSIMAVSQYAMQIMMSLLMVVMIFIFITRAQVSAQRINAVLEKEYEDSSISEPQEFDSSKKGELVFDDVSFAFPGSQVPTIEHISFKTAPGQTTAIIGSTGSGKSTIVNLIPRFYDATEGKIYLNGADITHVSHNDVRAKIGFVPQKAMLFTGTIKDNLLYGNSDVSEDRLNKAIEVSQSKHFISKKEKGLDEEVSQGGKNFSGGQKQRLSIARALVKDAEIYIFDDSFSALDFKTDVRVRRALKDYTKNSAVIIVGQRVSSIMDADNIIVLDDGKIVGQGKHAKLLSSCAVYQEIVKSQLDPEEVENTLALYKQVSAERGE